MPFYENSDDAMAKRKQPKLFYVPGQPYYPVHSRSAQAWGAFLSSLLLIWRAEPGTYMQMSGDPSCQNDLLIVDPQPLCPCGLSLQLCSREHAEAMRERLHQMCAEGALPAGPHIVCCGFMEELPIDDDVGWYPFINKVGRLEQVHTFSECLACGAIGIVPSVDGHPPCRCKTEVIRRTAEFGYRLDVCWDTARLQVFGPPPVPATGG